MSGLRFPILCLCALVAVLVPQEPVTAQAASGDVAPVQPEEPAHQRPKRSRSKRPSVPSWDEIMFGRRDKSE